MFVGPIITTGLAIGTASGSDSLPVELFAAQYSLQRLAPGLLTTASSFTVDTAVGSPIQVDVTASRSDVNTWIQAPNGQTITDANIGTLNGSVTLFDVAPTDQSPFILWTNEPGSHHIFDFPSLGIGNYIVHYEAPAGLAEDVAIITQVSLQSTVGVTLFATQPVVTVGSPCVLEALVFDGQIAVQNANVSVFVKPPVANAFTINLLDNGGLVDGAANDGAYGGYFVAQEAGEYFAVAEITGTTSAGTPFKRMASTRVLVVAPCAMLTGNVSDHGQDDNADGVYDRLVIEAEVNVQTAGTFILQATLEVLGQPLFAHGQAVLPAGLQTIRASIDAAVLRATWADGPYRITNVSLLCVGDEGAMPSGSMVSDTMQTGSYSVGQFQPSPIELTGYYEELPIDTEGSPPGIDILKIQLGVLVLRPGPYEFEATLRDSCNGTIQTVSGSQELGTYPLVMVFSGTAIGQNGVNGPYSLENLYITGPMNRPARDRLIVRQVRDTLGYLVSSFDGASPQHDCNTNGTADACDIRDGDSWDCNLNGVPDECDITALTSTDCNANGMPDDCDALIDCNHNGIQDACEYGSPCPYAMILSASPPNGTRDARQPHPQGTAGTAVSPTSRQGIGSPTEPIVITLDVCGASSLQCWAFCETGIESVDTGTPLLSANHIASVHERVDQPGVYEITLQRPISAGRWTAIRYMAPSWQWVSWASLPANANGDSIASSLDIQKHDDCCVKHLCAPKYGNYSCDIDHDGQVTSQDTLTLTNLLNGAGTFIVWNGRTLGTNTCFAGIGGGNCADASCGGGIEPMATAMLIGPPGSPTDELTTPEAQNAYFADWFVAFAVSADPANSTEVADLALIVDALTKWCVDHFTAEERGSLAARLAVASREAASSTGKNLALAAVEELAP
jgi:hypothetical protein